MNLTVHAIVPTRDADAMKLIHLFQALCLHCICLTTAFAGSPLDSSISSSDWLPTALNQISVERMLADISVLSGPTLAGRQTGSLEDERSAAFVTHRFSELRLHRAPATPRQPDQPAPTTRMETNPLGAHTNNRRGRAD